MDKNLMELWGNYFLTAAKGQKQMEDFSKLAQGGFWEMPDMSGMMGVFSGMDALARASNEYLKIFIRANEEMQKSIKDFLALMDLVPRKDYEDLLEEYETYKKSVEEREKGTVGKVLAEELSLQTQGLKSFEELMRNQTRQFQDLMSNFTRLMGQPQTPKEEQQAPEEKKATRSRKKAPAAPRESKR
ncbi:MAG TPA: hypothetical protein PKM41_10945 [Deltaproteobacteria bacterium]|nr:hypothetical protein [Deltaproteobacteria bacterium]HOI06451.1 hypothetical protein [Deltaproteobacteria bacterium]